MRVFSPQLTPRSLERLAGKAHGQDERVGNRIGNRALHRREPHQSATTSSRRWHRSRLLARSLLKDPRRRREVRPGVWTRCSLRRNTLRRLVVTTWGLFCTAPRRLQNWRWRRIGRPRDLSLASSRDLPFPAAEVVTQRARNLITTSWAALVRLQIDIAASC